jgi:uncharacterized protein YndB with AHSA1/START domain
VPQPLPISASVEVAAAPDAVWAVVSDVTRMPEWSPELRRLFVIGSKEPRVGMNMVGINRRKYVAWPTTSKVVRLEPGRAIAWKTRESGATWTYELEPTESGTRVTGRRDLPAFTFGTTLLAPVIGGAEGHDQELADGIRSTLEQIKATVEAAAPSQV